MISTRCAWGECESRQVLEYPDYFVCPHGTVFSFRPANRNSGPRKVPKTLRMLLTGRRNLQYHSVRLHNDRGHIQALVHRLVLECFVGPRPEGMEACHNDGNPVNNDVENLRWDWPKANQFDRVGHGTFRSKLSPEDVPNIRDSILPTRALAAMYCVGQTAIRKVKLKETWKHLS